VVVSEAARPNLARSGEITPELVAEHGLSGDEYNRVIEILGREPNLLELGIFSVMWSEHCSYKSSKIWLKTLPTQAPHVIHGPGENAGVIDIGDGLAAIFKMESHNHPSFIEPRCGSAIRSIPRPGTWSPGWSRASAATATASAYPRSAARSISTPATTATSWSTP
jgi:phosphoribosylformylglycinamidine synthase